MLGIRHFNNTAIDLWAGDENSFVSDELLPSLEVQVLKNFIHGPKRHLSLVCENEPNALVTLEKLKEILLEYPPLFKKRITLIFSNTESYKIWQDVFFTVFSD